nr:PQQ-like beta-propeller repeat protein [Arenibacter sp. N53]
MVLVNQNSVFSQKSWVKKLPGIGTFSSPRIADLNQDGTGDIIIGAGKEELKRSDSAVIAVSGIDGKLLWKVSAKDQIFGSATLKDINNDKIYDVFIGGRSAQLLAINGKTGKIIWRFEPPKNQKKEWFNFYNPQFIPDQNNDGQEDLLVSNGGNVLKGPYDPDRPVGYLVILNSKNGALIQKAPMPDGKETYMSVTVLPNVSENFRNVIYGTGGETMAGNLYATSIKDIMTGDISNSITLASGNSSGFIGPAAWVDINNDGVHDIVANTFDGRMIALDGITYKPIWNMVMPDTQAYGSIAIGNFTDDSIPDFFTSYAQGQWPNLEWSKQIMVNGKNGKVELMDSLGYYQMSTPIAVDLNNDGKEEAILPMNYQVIDSLQMKYFYNDLAVIDFSKKETTKLNLNYEGNNLSSTPWVGDLDNNGFLDIIYIHGTNLKQTYTFDGLKINRIDTDIPISQKIKWGSYMGSNYNGVYDH